MRSATIAFILLVLALPARADHVSIDAVQQTIAEQIVAFRSGDHKRAYELSAPNVRENYPTLAAYMALIRDSFQPLANARVFTFGRVDEINVTTITQERTIEGSDGAIRRSTRSSFKATAPGASPASRSSRRTTG
ncbi:DUF4864 domain-containing protein [Aminobacter sp. UC22_36]|uniref:DUF4864 domain-containing protein n=1 Tax=Aminobacter sp. UC22_36 TaxID=3374549 RepID=UPI00375690D5